MKLLLLLLSIILAHCTDRSAQASKIINLMVAKDSMECIDLDTGMYESQLNDHTYYDIWKDGYQLVTTYNVEDVLDIRKQLISRGIYHVCRFDNESEFWQISYRIPYLPQLPIRVSDIQ